MRIDMMEQSSESTGVTSAASSEAATAPSARPRHHPGTIVMFALLGVAGLGLAGMYFKYAKSTETIAQTTALTASGESVQQFLTSGQADLRGMRDVLAKTEKLVAQFGQQIENVQVPLEDLGPSPFDTSLTIVRVTPVEGDVTTMNTPVADTSRAVKEQQQRAALDAARRLKLQSILVGKERSHCLIDGKLYTVGESIDGFIITSIASDRVGVSRGSFDFVLQLRQ